MKNTMRFVIFIIVICLVYEFVMLTNNVEGDTISEGMWKIFHDFPLFAFVLGDIIGMLKGHFWWPINNKVRKDL